jgi:hypothetical protein
MNVFISYRRTDPDQLLTGSLVKAIERCGHSVFWDNRIGVGKRWADVIEQRIREAEFFVILISEESMRSDMVRGEVKLAHELSLRPERTPVILPVRVAYSGELPYDLGAYLNPIQYVVWNDESDSVNVAKRLIAAINGQGILEGQSIVSSSGLQQLFEATEKRGAPLPKAELRFETGTLKLDSPFYVVRRQDARVLEAVSDIGTTTVIKGVRQIGKSSLLARAIAAAKTAGLRTFYMDFQSLEQNQLGNLSTLLKVFARRLAREVQTAPQPEDFWSEEDGPKTSISEFLRGGVLLPGAPRLAIFLDEVDLIFAHPEYRDDFFSTLRFWHNQRANNPEVWDRLNIVIAHSTEPSLWIQDIHQSPFNVGDRVRLVDFDASQIAELNCRYGGVLKGDEEISKLHDLLGGHPYLVRQALYSIAMNDWTFDRLDEEAANSDGPFGDHLKRYVFGISRDPKLKAAFKNILQNGKCDEEGHFQRLIAVGLVQGPNRRSARVRCQLYQRYFSDHL